MMKTSFSLHFIFLIQLFGSNCNEFVLREIKATSLHGFMYLKSFDEVFPLIAKYPHKVSKLLIFFSFFVFFEQVLAHWQRSKLL